MKYTFNISDVRPYIEWLYFYHSWGLSGKPESEKVALRKEAEAWLDEWEGKYHTYALLRQVSAVSEGDDILISGKRFPMLRQQDKTDEGINLCMADFIRPNTMHKEDTIGLFCTTVDEEMERAHRNDPYDALMSQTLADRLAEATAEKVNEKMPGIRPAVGYPSMPDMSINFLLDNILDMKRVGIRLTDSGMMIPHASVSGIIIQHPQARYFELGRIGEDQLEDYACRRNMSKEEIKRFIKTV